MHAIMVNKTLPLYCLKTKNISDNTKSHSNYHVMPEVQFHNCLNHPKGLQSPE